MTKINCKSENFDMNRFVHSSSLVILIILYYKSFVSMGSVFDLHDLNSLFLFVWLEMLPSKCFVRNCNSLWLKPIVNYGSLLELFQPLFWWYLKDDGCQCPVLIDYLEVVLVNNSLLSSQVSLFKKILKSPSQVYFGEGSYLLYPVYYKLQLYNNCIHWLVEIRVVWLRQ